MFTRGGTSGRGLRAGDGGLAGCRGTFGEGRREVERRSLLGVSRV